MDQLGIGRKTVTKQRRPKCPIQGSTEHHCFWEAGNLQGFLHNIAHILDAVHITSSRWPVITRAILERHESRKWRSGLVGTVFTPSGQSSLSEVIATVQKTRLHRHPSRRSPIRLCISAPKMNTRTTTACASSLIGLL